MLEPPDQNWKFFAIMAGVGLFAAGVIVGLSMIMWRCDPVYGDRMVYERVL